MRVGGDKSWGRARTLAGVSGITLAGVALYAALLAWFSHAEGPGLEQVIGPARFESIELQVAIHDLVEQARPGTVIGVCRALASEPVTLEVAAGARLREVLEEVASQVHAELIMRAGARERKPVPTVSCPTANGDYLEIGPRRGSV